MASLSRRGADLATVETLRASSIAAWQDRYHADTNANGIVNMSTSENFLMQEELAEFINEKLTITAEDLSYGEGLWGNRRLRQALASYFNQAVEGQELFVTNGVTSLFELLGYALAAEGDAILLTSPSYSQFKLDFSAKARVKTLFVAFDSAQQTFTKEAIAKYEQALRDAEEKKTTVRAVLLCNPHNPLGRCYPRETIVELLKFCSRHSLHLISDEIYAMSVFAAGSEDVTGAGDAADGEDSSACGQGGGILGSHAKEMLRERQREAEPAFTSVLSIDYEQYIEPAYVHVLYGVSKDLAASALRLGCVYTRNTELVLALENMSQFHWLASLSEKAVIQLLEDEAWTRAFLEKSRARLRGARDLLCAELDAMSVPYWQPYAGFFVLLDLRRFLPPGGGWAGEKRLSERFRRNRVILTEGGSMSAAEPGYFRLIFSHPEPVLREGLTRLRAALNEDG